MVPALLVGTLAAGGCIDSLGEVSGNAAAIDAGSGTSSTSAIEAGDSTTTSTTTGTTGGAATTRDATEAGSNASDDGARPTFDIGGAGDGRSGSESSSDGAPEPDPPPPNDGDCCMPGDGTGCADAVVSACVCADDPYCCDTTWDDLCVAEVTNLGCAACGGVEPAGFDVAEECCSAHEGTGCGDQTISTCVCDTDPYCCMIAWDDVCVQEIADYGCGSCDAGTSSGTDSGTGSTT